MISICMEMQFCIYLRAMYKPYFLQSFLVIAIITSFAYSCNHNTNTTGTVGKALNVSPGKGFEIQGLAVSAPPSRMDSTVYDAMIAINTNSIAVIPYAFCRLPDAEIQYNSGKQWWGETDEGVRETVRMAHAKNISVMLKPHLWIAHGSYTGDIKFTDDTQAKKFEESYTAYILHFAQVAEASGVNIFCIGTELGGIVASRPQYFPTLIAAVRKVYHGKVTYAANWDDYKRFNNWDLLDYIGVDAYFPLSEEKELNIATLQESWKPIKKDLEALHLRTSKPILFAEYGYRNSDYSAKEPWNEDDKTVNDKNQSIALEALYSSFQNEKWFAGGYLWKWYVDKRQLSFNRMIDFTPQGRVGLETVKKWYK